MYRLLRNYALKARQDNLSQIKQYYCIGDKVYNESKVLNSFKKNKNENSYIEKGNIILKDVTFIFDKLSERTSDIIEPYSDLIII